MPFEPMCRFEAVRDPVDNWMVWDNSTDCPAEIQGLVLIGLNEHEANLFARILEAGSMQRNDIYGRPASCETPLRSSDLNRKLDFGWYFARIRSNYYGFSIRIAGRTRLDAPRTKIESDDG